MDVKFRGTLIALALALILGGYVLYSTRQEKRTAAQREALARLVPISPSEVVRITCVSGQDQILLERRGPNWVISHPISADCDIPVFPCTTLHVEAALDRALGAGG